MGTPKHPLFPRTIAAQISDLHTKINFLSSNASRLGIPAPAMLLLTEALAELDAAHVKVLDKDTRTRLDTAAQQQAIRTAQRQTRKILDFYVVDNPAATRTDYEALSIPVRGPVSILPAPEHVPGIGHITSANLAVIVPFSDAQSNKRAKPAGVHALEAAYQLGGDEPADVRRMPEEAVATSSPLRLQFDFADEFKLVYLAFRWVGTRGDHGPWTDIHKVNVSR
jgi:hypothetical protein